MVNEINETTWRALTCWLVSHESIKARASDDDRVLCRIPFSTQGTADYEESTEGFFPRFRRGPHRLPKMDEREKRASLPRRGFPGIVSREKITRQRKLRRHLLRRSFYPTSRRKTLSHLHCATHTRTPPTLSTHTARRIHGLDVNAAKPTASERRHRRI